MALGGLAVTAVLLGVWFVRVDGDEHPYGACYRRPREDKWNWTDGRHCHKGGDGHCKHAWHVVRVCHYSSKHGGNYCKQCCQNCDDNVGRDCKFAYPYYNSVSKTGWDTHYWSCCYKRWNCDRNEWVTEGHSHEEEFQICKDSKCHYTPCDNGKHITKEGECKQSGAKWSNVGIWSVWLICEFPSR